ncbi:MAG: hypothetical protein C5B48_08935 [Candidatus Rokuibacteriota bacterium]|nr:MAG: hypothetical protein C5B48_08935 [Candidatus Rokubacteria bacterium]
MVDPHAPVQAPMKARRSALALIVPALLAAGCGGSRTGRAHAVAAQLRARLVARGLPPRWVACVPTRARVLGRTAYRCNVDFGDIHIEAYCAARSGSQLAYAEWRPPVQGRESRVAAQKECARRLSGRLG